MEQTSTPIPDTPTTGRLSSVAAALQVLMSFSHDEAELGISAIAKKLGLAKSTVHRLVVTLAADGFLEQNPENGRYRLGLTLFELGALVRLRMDVSNQARPVLGELRDHTQEAVHLAILSHSSIVYLYNLESSRAIGIRSHIGARKPAFCTAEGRVLLAYAGDDVVQAVLSDERVARTPNTVTDLRRLRQILAEVRQSGYALDDEESELDTRAVAAPIFDSSGHAIAALGLAGPTHRLTKKELRGIIPQVTSAAMTVSARMGYKAR